MEGITETIRRINSGKSKQRLTTALKIQGLLQAGVRYYDIPQELDVARKTYKSYVNPSLYDELSEYRSRFYDATQRTLYVSKWSKSPEYLEVFSLWEPEEIICDEKLPFEELVCRYDKHHKFGRKPLKKYLTRWANYNVLLYETEDDCYSVNLGHPFIQKIMDSPEKANAGNRKKCKKVSK